MNRWTRRLRLAIWTLGVALALGPAARADEPYARSRTYDLQNARMELRFDTAERKVMGQVTHTLAPLHDGLDKVEFDSIGLKIEAVTVGGRSAKFETTGTKLIVQLERPARAGQKLTVAIRYEGQPSRGLYFVLPDKDYPDRPVQLWTQGQTEDTRYYIPIYDYPNDKTTSEMILTVPATWTTVSNGKLITTRAAGEGMKTWHWRLDQPHSTYLIALVAGEFDVVTEDWRGIPLTYYAPRGRGNRIKPSYGRTPAMMDYFTAKFGPYPWAKYAQAMVDEFVAGGMENTTVTINNSGSLEHPELVPEFVGNDDDLISHELGHQWFGDSITTKDWGHVWLNESFASYMESLWFEHHYGADQAAYVAWGEQNQWFGNQRLYAIPLVTHNFRSFIEVTGNVYGKGSRIVHMLRQELGDEDFFRALRHFLQKHRYQSVATADLVRAIEESTGKNVDPFFDQWIYGAGAPRLTLSYTWDASSKQVKLAVQQTQKPEGRVGIFRFKTTVDILTAAGVKSHPVSITSAERTFTLPSEEKPLAIVFDPQNVILKRVEFKKEPAEWAYQLQHATHASARLDAARALGAIKENANVVAALSTASRKDSFWAVRAEAIRALAQIGGAAAQEQIVSALGDDSVAVRRAVADAMGRFKDDPGMVARIERLYREDKAWRVRQSALAALARQKPANAADSLQNAVETESPDNILRNQALQSFGGLGKDEAVPLLLEWSKPGRADATRRAAIGSLGQLDKKNKELTATLLRYLQEPRRSVNYQFTVFSALVQRGDTSAIEPMEQWLDTGTSEMLASFMRPMLAQLKQQGEGASQRGASPRSGAPAPGDGAGPDASSKMILDALQRLEKAVAAMDERMKKIEEKVGKN